MALGFGGFRIVPAEVACLFSNFPFSIFTPGPFGGPWGGLGNRGLYAVGLGVLLDAVDFPMGSQEPLGTREGTGIRLIILKLEPSESALYVSSVDICLSNPSWDPGGPLGILGENGGHLFDVGNV